VLGARLTLVGVRPEITQIIVGLFLAELLPELVTKRRRAAFSKSSAFAGYRFSFRAYTIVIPAQAGPCAQGRAMV